MKDGKIVKDVLCELVDLEEEFMKVIGDFDD